MTVFDSLILGLVEGVTEFLPISSTGHLILAASLLGIDPTNFLTSFEIAIQLGAILAVPFLYIKDLLRWDTITKLVVAFLPAGIIGLAAYPFLKTYLLESTEVVLWSLFIGGVVIILFEWRQKNDETETPISSISYRQSFLIGLAQAVAIIPGVSRSAATILGGRALGIARVTIVKFSFLLALPTMAVAVGFDLIKQGSSFASNEWLLLGIGFVVSFITALFSMIILLRFVRTKSLTVFGFYRIALVLAMLLLIG